MRLKDVLSESADFDLKLIPTLAAKGKSLKDIFADSKPKNVLVLIGPEGDFTDEEIGLALKAGFIPVTLGDLVLRVETACLAVASFIRLYENS
jgi:16S rRNA (uracil1498-N3)-methyltransferase